MHVSSAMTPDPIVIGPSASLHEASRAMDRADVRHLVVVEGGRVVGVLSDRDLLGARGWRRGAGGRPAEGDAPRVRDVMHAPVVTVAPGSALSAAAVELSGRGIGCLPVLEGGKPIGILSELDLLGSFRAAARLGGSGPDLDPPVSSRMRAPATTVSEDATLDEALRLCRANGMRHLPVVREGELCGILSDRDLRRALGEERDGETGVAELMTREVRTISPDAPLSEAAKAMVGHKVSSLPVVDGGRLEGILTLTDLLDHCMEALREPKP